MFFALKKKYLFLKYEFHNININDFYSNLSKNSLLDYSDNYIYKIIHTNKH